MEITRGVGVGFVVASVLVALLVLSVPRAEARSYSTTSSFSVQAGSPDKFSGRVSSPGYRCRTGRLVKVYRLLGGSKRLVGTARAALNGEWEIERNVAPGWYKVVVPRKDFDPVPLICRSYTRLPLLLL